jgi:hypothetical protein
MKIKDFIERKDLDTLSVEECEYLQNECKYGTSSLLNHLFTGEGGYTAKNGIIFFGDVFGDGSTIVMRNVYKRKIFGKGRIYGEIGLYKDHDNHIALTYIANYLPDHQKIIFPIKELTFEMLDEFADNIKEHIEKSFPSYEIGAI